MVEKKSNTIPDGYKQTDVGMIPKEWEVNSFGEVFCFLKTASNSRADLSIDEEISYIHYGDIHTQWNHKLDFENSIVPTISSDKLKGASFIQNGDLVIADASEDYEGIGKSIEIVNLNDRKAISGLHTFLLRDKSNAYVDGFRGYIQSIKAVNVALRRITTGLKVFGISKANLKNVLLPIPPLPEQRAIAAALSDVDALIASLDALIAKKRLIKQGAMQELLTGQRRLPGFKGVWNTKKLFEVLILHYGKSQKGISIDWGKYPIIGTSGKMGQTNQYLYDKPSIVIGRKGTIDIPQYIDIPFWTIDTAFYTEIADQCNPKYLYYLLTTIDWYSYNEASGVPSLNARTIGNIEVSLPEYVEQSAIAELINEFDAEITALEQRRQKTLQLKQGMMQELLTGRIRLV